MLDYNQYLSMANRAIERLELPARPAGLYDPIRYALSAGGKRLRPVLTLAVCHALDRDPMDAIHQAVALEMFHNFTLLHDDLMDRSDTRRGLPTVWRKWNADTAILSGDAMLTTASRLVQVHAGPRLEAAMNMFDATAMGVYEGQQYDMDFESRLDVTVKEYMEMIRLKTSVLLGCACSMGALMADVNEQTQAAWFGYGENLGLAFQLQDDYLDTFGDPKTFGKPIGGDIRNNKKTWLLITALAEAPERVRPLLDMQAPGKVEAMRAVYEDLDLPRRCHDLIDRYIAQALERLGQMGLRADSVEFFTSLARRSATRQN